MRLVDFKTAKLLHKLGYDGAYDRCFAYHDGYEDVFDIVRGGIVLEGEHAIPRPRIDDVAYWFNERHKIFICVDYRIGRNKDIFVKGYNYSIRRLYGAYQKEKSYLRFDTYDDALEKGIKYALTLIHNGTSIN